MASSSSSSKKKMTPLGVEAALMSCGYSVLQVEQAFAHCGETSSFEELELHIVRSVAEIESDIDDQGFGDDGKEEPKSEESKIATLLSFGYDLEKVQSAVKICGDVSVDVLLDHIDAAHLQDEDAAQRSTAAAAAAADNNRNNNIINNTNSTSSSNSNISNNTTYNDIKRKRRIEEEEEEEEAEAEAEEEFFRGDMTGFGLFGQVQRTRSLNLSQQRRPFFYFENVSTMPAGEWHRIVRRLDGIRPEFVDAKHFSVCSRPRGYVHNLPLENRYRLQPLPPQTIRELLPGTARYIPEWDYRLKLNCINTVEPPRTTCNKIHAYMTQTTEISDRKKTEIMNYCKKLNLVWTGPCTVSPLEPVEMERALGYEENHTRGDTGMRRVKSLGNSFQVDTVGFHLSALKVIFPDGIRVLSLFSGIGGAEVALHKAGIKLKHVVSVEKEESSRRVLERWWITSGQTGKHIIMEDVQDLTHTVLKELVKEAGGGFDLIIGGSPCNNLSGNNRSTRCGLAGDKSSLFFEFPRILNSVRGMMN